MRITQPKKPRIKQAKIMSDEDFDNLFRYIDKHSLVPERDKLIFALSFKAGLRIGEIAKLPISAMTDAKGKVREGREALVHITSDIGKKGNERKIPMVPFLRQQLLVFMARYPDAEFVAFSSQPFRWSKPYTTPRNLVYRQMTPNCLATYVNTMLKNAAFEGASSHSGRRTFATLNSRRLAKFHTSLRDLQLLMGHVRMETTERYMEPSQDVYELLCG